MARPLGVVLIAVYNVISGIIFLLAAFAVPALLARYPNYISAGLLGALAFAIWAFATTYGIWMYQRWGWYLMIASCVVTVPICIAFLYFDRSIDNMVAGAVNLVLVAVIAGYLLRDPVKKLYFG